MTKNVPMTTRKRIVAGNWKMNLDYVDAERLIQTLSSQVSSSPVVEVILCPSFLYISTAVGIIESERVKLSVGAQNCHTADSGAYTGEVSASMIASVGASYVIIGHSERRTYFSEKGSDLVDKVNQVISHGLKVIFCFGETLDQREAGAAMNVVSGQLSEALFHLSAEQMSQVVLAYEPVWAIGTGKTASEDEAQEMHQHIRKEITNQFGMEVGQACAILYGGSVKPDNANGLFSMPDIDGGLIGGASLKSEDFVAIIKAAQSSI